MLANMSPSPPGQAIPHRMLPTSRRHPQENDKCDADLCPVLLLRNEQEAALRRSDPSNTHDGLKSAVKPALAYDACPRPMP
jgi:hypothetical protein